MATVGVVRGCGTRKKGGIYLEVPLSPYGLPLESFIVDPPAIVDLESLGLTAIGVKLIEKDGVTHVFDIVGEEHYPNVADFLEEVRRFGVSRRISKSVDFSRLTEASKLILIHRRAHIDNPEEYWSDDRVQLFRKGFCPREVVAETYQYGSAVEPHGPGTDKPMCAALWWHDIENGCPIESEPGEVIVPMPSFEYLAFPRPTGITPKYQYAIFASFNVPRITVINDPEGGTHEEAFEKASKSSLPIVIEEE